MNYRVQLIFIVVSIFLLNTPIYAAQTNKVKDDLIVISIYQIEDESSAGFDFFTSQKAHKCGGKLSNRYRSYSDHKTVNDRKFQLVLAALNHQHTLSIKSHGCEGNAMLVDYIGISK
jgi:hypothetical protein